MSIPFQIPVKPHVHRFLSFHFQEPYKLDRNDFLGNWLYLALRDQHKDSKFDKRLVHYSRRFTVLVTRNYVFNNRLSDISGETIAFLNGYVDSLIKQQFICYMLVWADLEEMQDTIEKFLNIYSFTEEELKFDCLKKYWYRWRVDKQNSILSSPFKP